MIRFALSLALALMVVTTASADVVLTNPTSAIWKNGWTVNNAVDYWDHTSSDGPINCNIGGVLTGVATPGGCSSDHGLPLANPPGVIPYVAKTSAGDAPDSITLTNTLGGSAATLLVEIAGNYNQNIFGWYDVANPNSKTVLFPAGSSGNPVVTAVIPAAVTFGFYITTPGNSTFYSNSALGNDAGNQHFALFSQTPPFADGTAANNSASSIYWVGVEDLALAGSDKDYNDMVVRITQVPEPGAIFLFGTLLTGTALLRRRRRP